jgi:hypothetical protein
MREAAENVLNHLVRSFITTEGSEGAPAGQDAGPWCALVERVSQRLTDGTAYTARALLSTLTERVDQLSPTHLVEVGAAARRLLEYAWYRTPRDRWLVIHALQFVCRTFESDRAESTVLLRRVIEAEHLRAHGSEELPWLADEIEVLVTREPDLVRDIYIAAFEYRETSNEPSPMGGIVMPLVSNRRQDYDGALFRLEKAFPAFLRNAPEHAIEAVNAALEAHVARDRLPLERKTETTFDFGGTEARVREDYSHIWDRGQAYRDEKAIELLDGLEAYLDELAGGGASPDEIGRVVNHIVKTASLAAIWRRLLKLGARHPTTIGLQLRYLTWAPPILLGSETGRAAGELIRSIAPHLDSAELERLERAIMALPTAADPTERGDLEHTRDRLLGCLETIEPITEEARARLKEIQAANAVPENRDDAPLIEVSWGAHTDENSLRAQGVPVEEESNRRLRQLEAPVREYTTAYRNERPDQTSTAGIIPHLRSLHDAVGPMRAEGVHPRQAEHAWETLACGCAAVLKWATLSCSEEPGTFLRAVLLEASELPTPRHDPESDSSFDKFQSWGPGARISAAEGLMGLVSHPECADAPALGAIARLSTDPVPAVRYQVAIRLVSLYNAAPGSFWTLLDQFASAEHSRGVLVDMVKWPLFALRFHEPQRMANAIIEIYGRVEDGPGAKEVLEACVDVLVDLHLSERCDEVNCLVLEIADNVFEHLEQAAHMAPRFRECLVAGPPDGTDPAADAARGRAFELLRRLTTSAKALFEEVSGSGDRPVDGDDKRSLSEEQLRTLGHLFHSVAFDLYLVSGAYRDEHKTPPSLDVQARLLREASPLIDLLADVGLPSVTHYLLEALEFLVPVDPYGVFMKIAAVILGGRKGGYQYDSMAERILVRIVERYFAEFRSVFQRDEEARSALIAILDTFVEAGSAGARRLSYGLDGIFR